MRAIFTIIDLPRFDLLSGIVKHSPKYSLLWKIQKVKNVHHRFDDFGSMRKNVRRKVA